MREAGHGTSHIAGNKNEDPVTEVGKALGKTVPHDRPATYVRRFIGNYR